MSFRLKVLGSSLLVLFLSIGLFSSWTVHRVTKVVRGMEVDEIDRQLQIVAPLVELSNPALEEFTDGVASRSGYRVTVVDVSGKVVADSSFSGAALSSLENHLGRPEVAEAFRSGSGHAIRFSTSESENLYYVARRLPDGSGVVRFAKPPEATDELASILSRAILLASVVVLVLGGVVIGVLSQRITAGIEVISDAARKISGGDFVAELPIASSDEVGQLARDIEHLSARMKGQLALLQSERNHLTAVLDSMTEGVLVTDPKGRITSSNPALRAMLGLNVDPVGRMPLEVIRSVEVHSVIQGVLSSQEPRELEVHHGEGVFLARIGLIGTPENPAGSVAVFTDISEVRRLEGVQRDFISNVSHELKTPLTSIQGYAETLMGEESLLPVHRRFAEKIFRNASQLSSMIGELFSLARLERTQRKLVMEGVRFRTLVQEVRAELEEQLAEKSLGFEVFDRTSEGVLYCAPGYLRRVLRNLIENGIQYTEAGGISVSLEEAGGDSVVSVRDTGSGVAEEHLERIFERFYRVDKDRSRRTGGTGIGLAIVKHIVELHGGKVWAQSKLGKGTVVFVRLPKPVSALEGTTETEAGGVRSDDREARKEGSPQ